MTKHLEIWKKSKYRNLWQSLIWFNFQKSINRKIKLIENNNSIALLIKHKLIKNFSWIEIPRGPLLNDNNLNIFDDIVNYAKKENAVFVRMSPVKDIKIDKFKTLKTNYDHHPENTLIIDLNKSNEDILKEMKPKGRYNIKIAEKNNIQIEKSNNIDEFYNILITTSKRDSFFIHPKEYYQKMLNSMPDNCILLLAKYKNKAIAGGIFIFLEEYATYYYGASDNNYRNLMPAYILQWEAIKEAKKRNCKYYDFLGIAPENNKKHRLNGVSQFKKKFGGNVITYPKAQDIIVKPFYYFLYKIYKKLH